MKKIIYLFALSFAFYSCSEESIVLNPYDSVKEGDLLKTPTDFESLLSGAYAQMIKTLAGSTATATTGYGGEFLIDTEVMTDNVIINQNGRQSNLNGFRLISAPSNSHLSYYSSAYRPAELATRLILNIDKIPQNAQRDNIEGQARFIRALCHFDLVRIYSKIPTQSPDANQSLGMFYLDVISPFLKPSRPTVEKTYEKIIADLLIAKDKIGTASTGTLGRANRTAVYALLSRVYLYMGDYNKVIQYGNLAVSGNSVCPMTDFVGLWDDLNSSGVLFKLKIEQVDAALPGVPFSQTVGGKIRSEYVLQKSVADLFKSTDIRKTAYIKTSDFSGKIYNNIIKYDGRPVGNANIVDVKVIRLEEVYLNLAEAQYRIDGGGLAFLDAVRAQRYSSFISGAETGQALLDAILLERRLELAFEMDRFFTLKRTNVAMTRIANEGDYSDGTGTNVEVSALTIPVGSFKWQLPIPQDQRDLNPNLQQNPGY
jgi:starch-binding outer membrane protein, SusD/RagB family